MKRKRPQQQQLRIASEIGWVAEIPYDIWNVIITHLPEVTRGIQDLGLMLSIMGTCKTICLLFKDCIHALISDSIAITKLYDPNGYIQGKDGRLHGRPDRHIGRLALFYSGIRDERNTCLSPYLLKCVTDKAYHTPEHLTNCASLLHLGTLEGQYLHVHNADEDNQIYHKHIPFQHPYHDCLIRQIIYIRPPSKKAYLLKRLYNDIGIAHDDDFIESIPSWWSHLRCKELFDALTELKRLKSQIPQSPYDCIDYRPDKFERLKIKRAHTTRVSIVNMLRRGGATIKTSNPSYCDEFQDIIVTIEGKQYSIYADKAMSFRKLCFYSRLDMNSSTKAYLLDSLHERNWDIVTKTDRFQVIEQ